MTIADFLAPSDIVYGLNISGRRDLLDDLARMAASRLDCSAQDVALALQKREDLGSTGLGGGVAIPHARFAFLAKPFGLFARLKRPVDFQAIDGLDVDLVFLLLLPASTESGQLGALAAVARKLRAADIVAQLRAAKTAAQLYSAIATYIPPAAK